MSKYTEQVVVIGFQVFFFSVTLFFHAVNCQLNRYLTAPGFTEKFATHFMHASPGLCLRLFIYTVYLYIETGATILSNWSVQWYSGHCLGCNFRILLPMPSVVTARACLNSNVKMMLGTFHSLSLSLYAVKPS